MSGLSWLTKIEDLSYVARQIVISAMFGDGGFDSYSPSYPNTVGFRVRHSAPQGDYALWKMAKIAELSPRSCVMNSDGTIWVKTRSAPLFRDIRSRLYQGGKKRWPSPEWAAQLDHLGFLLYILDDGTRITNNRTSIQFITRRPSLPSLKTTARIWEDRLGVSGSVRQHNRRKKRHPSRYFRLPRATVAKLLPMWQRLFDEHGLPECMRYKVVNDGRSPEARKDYVTAKTTES